MKIGSEQLLRYIDLNYRTVQSVKRSGRWAPAEDRGVCSELRTLIYAAGVVDFDGWSVRQVMVYIFLVNQSFHCAHRKTRWGELKRTAQKWIAQNHEGCVSLVSHGRFAGYYQAKYGEWTTHWPREVHPLRKLAGSLPFPAVPVWARRQALVH
jgi:hypothetical protein